MICGSFLLRYYGLISQKQKILDLWKPFAPVEMVNNENIVPN